MIRICCFVICIAVASPSFAQVTKEVDCGYQGDVVAAVQAARIARVGERGVASHVQAAAPEWPDKYNAVIALVTPWIYGFKRAEITSVDLGALWKEQCLAQ